MSDLYRSARSHEELKETSDAGFFSFRAAESHEWRSAAKSTRVQKSARVNAKEIKRTRARTVGLAPLCRGLRGLVGGGHRFL